MSEKYQEEYIELETSDLMVIDTKNVFQFESRYKFPNLGKQNAVYFSEEENASYRWDETKTKYFCVGRDYTEIKEINGGNANE